MSGLKDFINKIKSNPKLRNYIIVGLFGVMLMIAAGTLMDTPEQPKEPANNSGKQAGSQEEGPDSAYKDKRQLEKDIEEILSRIDKAGKVKVLITYEDEGELVTEKDVRQRESSQTEEDGEGGKRTITEKETESQVVYTGEDGNRIPFIKSEICPRIRGVVVVADGGDDEVVRGKITRALEVLLNLQPHKIHVVK